MKGREYRKFHDAHLVSNFSVILTDRGILAGGEAESDGNLAPGGCCNSRIRMQRRSSSQQSWNPRDIRLERRGASRRALSITRCESHEPHYTTDDQDTKHTLGDHERMATSEGIDIQEGEA